MATNSIKLLTGNSHPQLAELVASRYDFHIVLSAPLFSIIKKRKEKRKRYAANLNSVYRLGIELAKVMVLQYSNQESSISIGESVRDEDGIYSFSPDA